MKSAEPTRLQRTDDDPDQRENERRLATLLSNLPGMAYRCRTDRQWTIDIVSDGCEALTGYKASDLVGVDTPTYNSLIHPDDRERIWTEVQEAVEQELPFRLTYRILLPDGEERWVCDQGVGIFVGGELQALEGFISDTTKQKHAEAAQHESERRLRELLENIHLVSAMLDRAGNIIFCNDFLLRLTGWKRDEIMGRNWCELFVPPGQYDKELLSRQLSERAVPHQAKNEIITKAGERRMISWNNTILFDGAGNPLGVATIGEDITERLRLENELRQAQKLESIGRLAGGVAHDFNNLLTVINGYTDFILSELKTSDPLRSYADKIKIAGKRAASLTKQLLAFSRKQVIEPKVLDLNTSIQESDGILERLIGEDIALTTTLDPFLWQMMADPEQLHQVMMNLVVNARDAMPKGGRVTICTMNIELSEDDAFIHPDAKPGCYVMMSVTDSGVGMDEQTRQHIFEPFFTTKEKGKGTGLGLATVHGIVRQSDGWIDVSSELGVGTSFKIYFPSCNAPSVTEEQREPSRNEGPSGGETILMVEDDGEVRHFGRMILKRSGYHILEAANGEEALQIAKKHSGDIHLLLTDVVLPGINGMEVSERLKEVRPLVKALFVSGYTADVIARRGVLNPGVSLLHKPFTPDDLASKVREVLAGPTEAI
jgi:PAS domain S-box-containing protein